ncbi:phage shock protein A (IM30), suppresses sigma54-dependent transcription [Rubidibacter lacunae KORDI 51-2]|uniref:Phage shock protein A (IM30), suppresses sigma54-dependent transcription n=1 Tax=Rubidibacter lacunae KORDI 51-2 TaxID=582515 RepID=U5DJM1_9CHRO|nr:PspA/IM30 family protein [Rubidibacter lacunae]ERN40779.1 phage shock protein A (IM30), suppresses sigma54-dependent transcription [Rubidibacter lacunae KORDI 51-2]
MGLLDRAWRAARSRVTSWVSAAEDPEKILEQAVDDMQQDLIGMRQAVAQAIASQKRIERHAAQASQNADEWQGRAKLALSKGNEELAREALVRRKSYQDSAASYRDQIQQQSAIIDRLKRDLRSLESKISEARAKKDLFVARARSAKASQQLNDMLGGLTTGGSLNAFERMEDRVHELEAQSEASAASLVGDSLDERFRALEAGDRNGDVDGELSALKAELGSSEVQGELPPTSATHTTHIDRELDAIRSELDRT